MWKWEGGAGNFTEWQPTNNLKPAIKVMTLEKGMTNTAPPTKILFTYFERERGRGTEREGEDKETLYQVQSPMQGSLS